MHPSSAPAEWQAAPPSRCVDGLLGNNYKCIVPATAAPTWLQLNLHAPATIHAYRLSSVCHSDTPQSS